MPGLAHERAPGGWPPAARRPDVLRVAGLTPFSTVDYPGRLSAVVFCRGCNLRCRYCHNDGMQGARPRAQDISWSRVIAHLERRRGLLEAVVFSGGEPLLQAQLGPAMRMVREMGFKVGLHTAGMVPRHLEGVLPWVDWVGLDVKAAFADYADVTGVPGSGAKARAALELLKRSEVDFEVRTTADPDLIDPDRLLALADQLTALGVTRYRLQTSTLRRRDYDGRTERELASRFPDFEVRRSPVRAA